MTKPRASPTVMTAAFAFNALAFGIFVIGFSLSLPSMRAVLLLPASTSIHPKIQQVEREAALAASTKAMEVKLSREASRALQAEMLRRIERGHCPAPAALVGEAVAKAFMRTVFCCGTVAWHFRVRPLADHRAVAEHVPSRRSCGSGSLRL